MDDVRPPINLDSSRFMDRFRIFIRARHLAYKTEKTYCHWVISYIRFHKRRNPIEMGGPEIEQFLEYLSVKRNVAANTQKNGAQCTGLYVSEIFEHRDRSIEI